MIIADGQPEYGIWDGELSSLNITDYRRRASSDLWLPMREKRWAYLNISSPDVLVGVAVAHAGYLGSAFCYVYDMNSGLMWEQERTAPFAKGIRVDRELQKGVVLYAAGRERIRLNSDTSRGYRSLDVQLDNDGREIDIRVEIRDDNARVKPHQVCRPTVDGDFTLTHKAAGLPLIGSVRIGNERYELTENSSFAGLDLSFGYPARETNWRWASASGRSKCGSVIGINLVDPIASPEFHENVCWINGQSQLLGPATFAIPEHPGREPWTLTSVGTEYELNLTFQPLGMREQQTNLLVLNADFRQPFGYFTGVLHTSQGKYELENVPGVVEDHSARW